jgi:hypothetical protein
MLALVFFCGFLVIFYFSFSGISLRSNSRYSSPYGDSFLANYGKAEASSLGSSKDKSSTYNSTYPLTAPGNGTACISIAIYR